MCHVRGSSLGLLVYYWFQSDHTVELRWWLWSLCMCGYTDRGGGKRKRVMMQWSGQQHQCIMEGRTSWASCTYFWHTLQWLVVSKMSWSECIEKMWCTYASDIAQYFWGMEIWGATNIHQGFRSLLYRYKNKEDEGDKEHNNNIPSSPQGRGCCSMLD